MNDAFCVIDGYSYICESIANAVIKWAVPVFTGLTVLYYCVWIYPRWKKKLRDVPACSVACKDDEEEARAVVEYVKNVARLSSYVFVSKYAIGEVVKSLRCIYKGWFTMARIKCLVWVMHRVGLGVVVYRKSESDEADEYLRSEGVKDIITL